MQQEVRRPGRPERPVDPGNSPEEAFAFALRKLREDSGSPAYRAMARRVPYSASTLARAASGASLPHRDLALAYVRACGGDENEWRHRWDTAAAQAAVTRSGDHAGQGRHGAHRTLSRRTVVAVSLGTAIAAAGTATAVTLSGQHHQTPKAATSIAYRDGDDPVVTGCNQDVQTLEQVPVYLRSGQRFGTLLLRHSPSCAMSWGTVWGPDPHLYRVYIIARRPADGMKAPSSWALNTPPGSYGNMLSTSRSCVMVEAYVRTPQGTGPLAHTSCPR
jgi:hypothetical protein